MKFNYRELIGKIKAKFNNRSDCAKLVGICNTSLYEKLRGENDFKTAEIYKLIKILNIKDSEIQHIFFTPEVQKLEPERGDEIENNS